MKYAAHQPNYLPWIGFFHKMAEVDVFVILDDVQFTRGSYQNRVKIKTPQGASWLTQPVLTTGRSFQSTNETAFNDKVDWRTKHVKQIQANYARAPHAGEILPRVSAWIGKADGGLCTANARLIEFVAELLGLRCKIVYSSSLALKTSGAARIIDMGHKLGADAYLSGAGARKYQSEEDFDRAGIRLSYRNFQESVRPQLWGAFIPGLSVIDALLNVGVAQTANLLHAQSAA